MRDAVSGGDCAIHGCASEVYKYEFMRVIPTRSVSAQRLPRRACRESVSLYPRIAALLSVPEPLGGVYSGVGLPRLELAESNCLIVFAKRESSKIGPPRMV